MNTIITQRAVVRCRTLRVFTLGLGRAETRQSLTPLPGVPTGFSIVEPQTPDVLRPNVSDRHARIRQSLLEEACRQCYRVTGTRE